jgi:hypothetical protein
MCGKLWPSEAMLSEVEASFGHVEAMLVANMGHVKGC